MLTSKRILWWSSPQNSAHTPASGHVPVRSPMSTWNGLHLAREHVALVPEAGDEERVDDVARREVELHRRACRQHELGRLDLGARDDRARVRVDELPLPLEGEDLDDEVDVVTRSSSIACTEATVTPNRAITMSSGTTVYPTSSRMCSWICRGSAVERRRNRTTTKTISPTTTTPTTRAAIEEAVPHAVDVGGLLGERRRQGRIGCSLADSHRRSPLGSCRRRGSRRRAPARRRRRARCARRRAGREGPADVGRDHVGDRWADDGGDLQERRDVADRDVAACRR